METAGAPPTVPPIDKEWRVGEMGKQEHVPDVVDTKDKYPEEVLFDDGCPNIDY